MSYELSRIDLYLRILLLEAGYNVESVDPSSITGGYSFMDQIERTDL